jgi:hypothetical protein
LTPPFVIRDPAYSEDLVSGDATVRFAFGVPQVFQPGPGSIYILRLDLFNRFGVPQLGTKPRVWPVGLDPLHDSEEIVFDLPAGFVVDGPPKPAKLEGPYGLCERTVEVNGSTVVLRRKLFLTEQVVPASEADKVRAFLTEAAKISKATIVLRRQPAG